MKKLSLILIGALVWFFTANLSAQSVITWTGNDELSQCKTGQYVKVVQLTDTTCKAVALSDHPSAAELLIDTVEGFDGKRLAVVEICDLALWGHDDIRKLTLGPSVQRIGKMMCHLDEGLTEVVIEGHIDSIPADAFHGCKSLRRVTNGGEEMTLEGNTPIEPQMPEPAMVKEDEEDEDVVYHTVE